MTTSQKFFLQALSFSELIDFLKNTTLAKNLQKSFLGKYGPIKLTLYLLTTLADIDSLESDKASLRIFKKASAMLMEEIIVPILDQCRNAQNKIYCEEEGLELDELERPNIENYAMQEDINSQLLVKWWMTYLSILSDAYDIKKDQFQWENTDNSSWFSKKEEELLCSTFQALENHFHWENQLVRFCFSRKNFLAKVCDLNLLVKDPFNQIRNHLSSKIKAEGLALEKNKNSKLSVKFRKDLLKQLLDCVEHSSHNDLSKASLFSGHFSKKHPMFGLSHSVVYGDDGGLYALLNTANEEERKMLLETGDIQEEYLRFCEKKQKKSENLHKIVIGQGSFGKIRIAIALTGNETSNTMKAGQILCVKKTSHINKKILDNKTKEVIEYVSSMKIRENAWNDYSVADVGNLVFSPPVYDMAIIQPVDMIEEIHQKGYTFQKLVPVYDGFKAFSFDKKKNQGGKYFNLWEHQRSYLGDIFLVISRLLMMGICMTDIKPQNTLYDGENLQAVVIDLAGVVRKANRQKLEIVKISDINEFTGNWTAPEIVDGDEDDNVDLTKCMSFSLGLFIKKLILSDIVKHPYVNELSLLAEKMTPIDPKERITVEQGIAILKEIGKPDFSHEIKFNEFINKLYKETHKEPMKFGLNGNVFRVEESIIPLMISQVDPLKYEVKPEDFTFLKEEMEDFLYKNNSKEKVFVLLGSSGSGKSTILQLSYLNYLKNWKEDSPIPIYINLSVEEELISQWKWICTSLETNNLKFNLFTGYHYPLIIFMDSFDEVPSKINFVTKYFEDAGNNPLNKCIICCRTEFIQKDIDYSKYFQPETSENKEIKKRFIAPLDEKNFSLADLAEYLKKYYEAWKQEDENNLNLEQLLNIIIEKNLINLMKSGYMVHLTLEVLPQIYKNNIDAGITRSRIFQHYIENKMSKVEFQTQKLICSKLNPQQNKNYIRIIQEAAFSLVKILYNQKSTKTNNHKKLGKIFFQRYQYDSNISCFQNHILVGVFRALDLTIEIRGMIPFENISIGFSHDTIKNYFLTQAICDECLKETKARIIGQRLFVDDHILIGFLVELTKETEAFKNALKGLVYKSREEGDSNKIAAANSITVLIAANVSFALEDLSGVRISGANLRDGVFSGCDFSDADLTKVSLENCKLDHAIFQRTIMKDVNFGFCLNIKAEFNVKSCQISQDGKYILGGGDKGNIKIWDRTSGKLLKTIEGQTNFVNSVAFSPDGTLILSVSVDKDIKLSDRTSGKLLKVFEGHSEYVSSAAFSPDGMFILSGSGDKTIKLWDRTSGYLIKTFEGHASSITTVTFSSDGKFILSGSGDETIKIWDRITGIILKTFEGHTSSVSSVIFSPDDTVILSCSRDNTIKLWNRTSGNLLKTYKGHTNAVTSVAFSPDGTLFISGSYDNNIKLWDRTSGNILKTFEGHISIANCVAFSSDGTFFLSGSRDNTIKLWNRYSGNLFKTFEGHIRSVNSVAFSSDGRYLLSGSGEGNIKLWDRNSGNLLKVFEGHENSVSSVTFSPDGIFILSGSDDNTIKLWDMNSGKLLKSFEEHTSSVNSVAFSPDGTFFLSGSYDNTIKLWDSSSRTLLKTLEGHTQYVSSVAFSPDGIAILSGSKDYTIKLWDRISGNLLKTFEGHENHVNSVTFSSDGSFLLSGSYDNTIKLWDRTSGKHKTLEGHTDFVYSIAFSPDNIFIISGSEDNTIKLWDRNSGNLLNTFEGHVNSVFSVAFSPDGRSILSGSRDSTIRLLNRSTGKLIQTDKGYSNTINSMIFTPDGTFILSISDDNKIKLWDRISGKLLKIFEGYCNFQDIPKIELPSCFENMVSMLSSNYLCHFSISPSETQFSFQKLIICQNIELSSNSLEVFLDNGAIVLDEVLFKKNIPKIKIKPSLINNEVKQIGNLNQTNNKINDQNQSVLMNPTLPLAIIKKKKNTCCVIF